MFINELLCPVADIRLDTARVFLVYANHLRMRPNYPVNIVFSTATEAQFHLARFFQNIQEDAEQVSPLALIEFVYTVDNHKNWANSGYRSFEQLCHGLGVALKVPLVEFRQKKLNGRLVGANLKQKRLQHRDRRCIGLCVAGKDVHGWRRLKSLVNNKTRSKGFPFGTFSIWSRRRQGVATYLPLVFLVTKAN